MATPFADDTHANGHNNHFGGPGPSSAAATLPSPTSPSWRNIFRIGGTPGRKTSRTNTKSTLTLDTEFSTVTGHGDHNTGPYVHSPATISKSHSQGLDGGGSNNEVEGFSLVTGGAPGTLTPSSSTSFNTSTSNRCSSNSAGTLSSEYGQNLPQNAHNSRQLKSQQSNDVVTGDQIATASTASTMRGLDGTHAGSYASDNIDSSQSESGAGHLPTPSSSAGQERVEKRESTLKADKHRNKTQPVLVTPVADALPSSGPMSPKAASRGMTKFIRRVASAPNAKGLFSLAKSHREREGTTGSRTPTSMKGFGFLSPTFGSIGRNGSVPEVPQVPANGTNGQRASGQDSLDTTSSSSSNRRNNFPTPHPNHGPNSSPPPSYIPPSGHPQPTLAHSQSAQNLHGSTLSPPKGPRSTRANSSASGSFQFRSNKGKNKDPPERIGLLSTPPVGLGSGPDGTGRAPFRRTYSSNSIKVRSVEVNPGSFQKVKLLGRGDVGKVYLVREKKSGKLFAMKGMF